VKALRHIVCLLMICSGFVLVQGFSAASTTKEFSQAKSAADESLLQKLKNQASGSVRVEREPATDRAGFITVGRGGDLMPGNDARAVDKAATFLGKYGALLGASDTTQLKQTARSSDKFGTTVAYTQQYRGVPVFGAMVLAHLDDAGDLTAVNGTAVPNLSLSTTPRLNQAQIADSAVRYIKSDPPTGEDGKAGDTTGLRAASTDLLVYRMGLVRGTPGPSYLAYRVEVTNGHNIRDIVFMHAGNAKVLNRYSMIHTDLERRVYEKNYDPAALVWKENDPFPDGLTEDQQNIVRATGEAYWFFRNAFGRDSYDGKGHVMETVNNDPRISCPNANWNGTTTNYCNGVTSDDVVAHEWGHAYTEYTDNLIYQWQPGALNESYSDIWGETVDLINGRMDSDEGDISTKRPDNSCSTHSPATPVVDINSPESIKKRCEAGPAQFGPQLTATGVTGDVVQGLDPANLAGPSTTDACSPLTNGAAVSGKIALVDRGACAFTVKVKNAQVAGAIAVIVGDNVEATPGPMSGTDPTITIPSVRIRLSDRNLIVGALNAGQTVNVTMHDQTTTQRTDSYRWLVGEDSSAFGGAIRDMWTPTCHGDPGKVSDAQYYCASDDAGGVHSNSGVPNHGYALLVDGGTYNGRTIEGIGLTKAAHIYWRAQTTYQTPTTDFADHADALDAACADLIGDTVKGLSTAGAPENINPPAPLPDQTIAATDCAQVSAMAEAVELRKDPTQCNFQPLLAKNAPNLCASNQKRNVIWRDSFNDGLGNWDVTSTNIFGGPTFPWRVDRTLPSNRDGSAAKGPDPTGGSCDGSTDDHSSVTSMTTDPILIPGSQQKSPRVTFNHYVATETGYDGGNLKVRINSEGTFEVVPQEAYIFNKPTKLATEEAGNTNPLAGQDGFTGTDGGEVTGSWGQSQVDLTMIGARSGDSIELRFDMGMDGCNGLDGWYVDDVTVSTCKAKTDVHAVQSPRPSRYGTAPKVNVTVESLGGQGAPSGDVVVRARGGRVLGTSSLTNGGTRVVLPRFLKAGLHQVVARYQGSDLHASSRTGFTVRVIKAVTDTRLNLTPNPVVEGRRIFAKVTTTATNGFAPSGQAVLKHNGHVIGRSYLSNGHVQFAVDRNLPRGKQSMKAVYLGNHNVSRSADADTVRVVR